MIVRLVSSTVSATTSGNSAERVQYSGETGIVRISADEGCHIKIGGDSVSAGQTDYFVGKNYEVFLQLMWFHLELKYFDIEILISI